MRFLLLATLTAATVAARAQDAGPSEKGRYHILRGGTVVSFAEMVSQLVAADVIVLGEQHDHAEGHAFQLELLEALGKECPRLGLSLEMFEQDVQLVLDEYLAGHITESAFLAASRPWPRYKTDYRPLVEWCKANSRPVIASNVPRRYVNIVSRAGQSALLTLPRASRELLPRLPYDMKLPAAYEEALDRVFGTAHDTPAGSPMRSTAYMKEAQALWDSGMAQSIIHSSKTRRLRPVLHVVGSMHCERGYGIVDRLRRQLPRLRIVTMIVRPEPGPGMAAPPDDLGDFVILCSPLPASKP